MKAPFQDVGKKHLTNVREEAFRSKVKEELPNQEMREELPVRRWGMSFLVRRWGKYSLSYIREKLPVKR